MKNLNLVRHQIRIKAGPVTALAELNTARTAEAVWQALPLSARANTWGDEVYFDTPVKMDPEDAKEVVQLGEIAYWPPGRALCIFFGATPVSGEGEIRPASAVNIVGRLIGDPKVFKKVKHGEMVTVEKA